MSLYLTYNEFHKEYKIGDIITDELIKIGHIQEKILSLCSLMIYNIEYSEFILNDEQKYILGSEKILFSDTFENFLKINNIELCNIKEIVIHDRKRDENGNVIKDNIYIDSYNKWFQLEENENYIKRINTIFRGTRDINLNEPLHNLLSNLLDVRFDDINQFQREQHDEQPEDEQGDEQDDSEQNSEYRSGHILSPLSIEIPELPEISELPRSENIRYDFNPFLSNIFMSNHIPFNYYNRRSRNISYSPDNENQTRNDPPGTPENELQTEPGDENDPTNNQEDLPRDPPSDIEPESDPPSDPPSDLPSDPPLETFINNHRIYVDRYPFYRNNLNLFTEILTYNMLEVPINNIINTPINVGEDVTVALTDVEFDEIESFEFKLEDNNINDCLICLTDFCEDDKLKKLKCNHCFHEECIKQWICHQSNKCPICRTEIAKGEPKNI